MTFILSYNRIFVEGFGAKFLIFLILDHEFCSHSPNEFSFILEVLMKNVEKFSRDNCTILIMQLQTTLYKRQEGVSKEEKKVRIVTFQS